MRVSIAWRLLVVAVVLSPTGFLPPTFADDCVSEASQRDADISAAQVKADAVILHYQATRDETLTGFYTRLRNCVGPRHQPTVVGLRVCGALVEEHASIPAYGEPLNMYTRSGKGGRIFPPLDVGQEYRTALAKPIKLKAGDTVSLEVVSSEPLTSGVSAGIQIAGAWPLLAMREPFRVTKCAGPVSRVAWSKREVVCTGNQKKFDPLCAPQNNSGVISDADGSLYQFTAYYSVDEQYGGGRAGSFSRIYAFRKSSTDKEWQPLGLVADPVPAGLTYCGDPFAFRDHQHKPCLVYTTCDGTNGFADWKRIGAQIIRSETDSFAGPWGRPHDIFDGAFLRTEVDRVNCLRIYPRARTKDYVVLWIHGHCDISYQGAILPDLDSALTKDQIKAAPTLVRNQEEGGGGFVHGDKGYLSTWQIPNINDTTSIQRLYEFDLYDPLNPEKWRVVPDSWGWNDSRNPFEDGGATADSWSLFYHPESDMLWATSVAWSASLKKNSTFACSVSWEKRLGRTFWFGCPLVCREIAPVVEYAVGDSCSLIATITATGPNASAALSLSPSLHPLLFGGESLEVSNQGIRLVAITETGEAIGLTPYQGQPFVPGQPHRLRLQRDGYTITAWVNDQRVGPISITDPKQRRLMDEPQRFKFHGRQGCCYSIDDAVLVDSSTEKP